MGNLKTLKIRVDSDDASLRRSSRLPEVLIFKVAVESCDERVKDADSQIPSPFTLVKVTHEEACECTWLTSPSRMSDWGLQWRCEVDVAGIIITYWIT